MEKTLCEKIEIFNPKENGITNLTKIRCRDRVWWNKIFKEFTDEENK